MKPPEVLESGPTAEGHAASVPRPGKPVCRSVLMVGTHLEGMGGIRAVVKGYQDGGLFDRFRCVYVATHRAGTARSKIGTAVGAWIQVAIQLYKLDAPLVHVQTASRASFWRKAVVCLMARVAGRPYLLHVHGGEFMKFYDQESGALAKYLIRNILGHAALVLALSKEWRERLLQVCPTARVEVLHNAVALPDLIVRKSSGDREATVLFLGNLGRGKGTYDLVRAFALAVKRFPRLKLVCAGHGEIRETQRLAAQLGVAGQVDCPGWLDTRQKRERLAGAAVFALPSYAEGMPMALLEAMSWAVPVIASPVGGIPQLVRNESNGLLVAPGDIDGLGAALIRLLEDPALRTRLGAEARTTIESRFSLDQALEQLGQIYRRFGIEVQGERLS